MEFREITTPDERMVAFHVLVELRPHLTHESFARILEAAQRHDNYTLLGAFEGPACVAVMGYRVLYDFVHGKHLYIDDLVVTATRRSQGVGEKLLLLAEDKAQELECAGLRLCTGTENEPGMRFYDRCGWERRALVYKKKV